MELKLDEKGVKALNGILSVNNGAAASGVLNYVAAYQKLTKFLMENMKPIPVTQVKQSPAVNIRKVAGEKPNKKAK